MKENERGTGLKEELRDLDLMRKIERKATL